MILLEILDIIGLRKQDLEKNQLQMPRYMLVPWLYCLIKLPSSFNKLKLSVYISRFSMILLEILDIIRLRKQDLEKNQLNMPRYMLVPWLYFLIKLASFFNKLKLTVYISKSSMKLKDFTWNPWHYWTYETRPDLEEINFKCQDICWLPAYMIWIMLYKVIICRHLLVGLRNDNT